MFVFTTTSHHLILSPRAETRFEEQITLVSLPTTLLGEKEVVGGKEQLIGGKGVDTFSTSNRTKWIPKPLFGTWTRHHQGNQKVFFTSRRTVLYKKKAAESILFHENFSMNYIKSQLSLIQECYYYYEPFLLHPTPAGIAHLQLSRTNSCPFVEGEGALFEGELCLFLGVGKDYSSQK